MNTPNGSPQLICAGCAKPTSIGKPVCDDCISLFAEVGHPVCMLCDAGMLRDAQGMHHTAGGGHAGRCTAVAV